MVVAKAAVGMEAAAARAAAAKEVEATEAESVAAGMGTAAAAAAAARVELAGTVMVRTSTGLQERRAGTYSLEDDGGTTAPPIERMRMS